MSPPTSKPKAQKLMISPQSGPSPERTPRSNVRWGLLVPQVVEVLQTARGWPCVHLDMNRVAVGYERPCGIDSAGDTATKSRENN